ncbi:MAG: L,D-transpeptidase family protein [Pseudomonadota bacterium]
MTPRPAGRRDDLRVGPWGARFQGRAFACAIGRGGIRDDKREGDGATPAGVFRLRGVFLRRDRHAGPWPAIGPQLRWSDDPRDPGYNAPFRSFAPAYSAERLHRPDPLYDYVAALDHNWPDPLPGAGSAIFLHVWRRPRHPTEGCVAFAPGDIAWILARWRPWSRVVIRP